MANVHRIGDYKKGGSSSSSSSSGGGGRLGRNDYTSDDHERLVMPGGGAAAGSQVGNILGQANREAAGGGGGGGAGLPPIEITFWRNGVTIGDGPLMGKDDDATKRFMKCMEDGRCPPELLVAGKVPDVHPVDKHGEDYVAPPPPAYTAFSGGGHSMSAGASKQAAGGTVFTPLASPQEPTVDAGAPTCRIMIRTASGSRLVGKFNMTHTVRDLQAFLDAKAPHAGPYQLLAGRPPKAIEASRKTLAEAGLKGESLMQKKA
jgi:UBX domain-containing protein 1